MASNHDDQSSVRRYLLHQLTDEEHQQIEQRLLTEDELFEQLQAAEDELIDQYITGSISKDDAEMFEKHFLATPERQQKLRFAKAFRRYVADHAIEQSQKASDKARTPWTWPKFFAASPLRAVAFAALILVAGLGVWRIFLYQSDIDRGLIALNSAYREQRPIEARITQFNYAPYVTTRGEPERVNSRERDYAQRYLMDAVRDYPGAASNHALGKFHLANKEFDQAIKQFEEALRADPNNAQIFADLGAAYFEKGKLEIERAKSDKNSLESGKGLEDLSNSLEKLNKALEFNPNLMEARFNRALCLEYLSLPPRAEEEWREYLKNDSSSLWAEEARRRLHLLEEQKSKASQSNESLFEDFRKAYQGKDNDAAWLMIAQHRDVSGGPIENILIDNYLELATKGHEESLQALEVLSYAGQLERERAGDLFISDQVRFLRSVSDSQRNSLVIARTLMKAGRQNLIESKLEAAADDYARAKETFEKIGNTGEALYAEYPLGHSYLLQAKSEASLATFQRVSELCETHQYKWLLAQALNAMANVQIGLTNYSAALDASHSSLEVSEKIGDTTGVIKTTNQLAQQYFPLGNYPKSLSLHQQSLALAEDTVPEPMQSWRNYFSIAMPLNAMGLHSAAIEYEKEALRRAEEMKAPQIICRSYTILGLMYAGRGDYEEAIRNVDIGKELGKKIASEAAKKESIAYSSLQLGLLYRQAGDFNKSIESYDRALQLYGELDKFDAFSYVAHKGKLLSCIRHEGCASVEEEIETCLDLFEKYRLKILEQSNRDTFFDTEQNIYDVAIEYEFSRKNFQTAFEYSERARARSLLDIVGNGAMLVGGSRAPDLRLRSTSPAKSFEEVKAGIPADVQLLQYAVLRDRLLIWLVSNSDFVHSEKAILLTDLNEKVRRYLDLVSSPSQDADELTMEASALYDILIKPIEASLNKDKLVCIVPDKTLNYLPFGALVSGASKEYLVERHQLISAPSATMFLHSSASAATRTKVSHESLLSVGNPSFSHEQFPRLPDLPAAAKEAQEIKAYYQPALRLVGESATKRRVEAEIRRADVVHLAVHSIVDETFPLQSKLVLATDPHSGEQSKESDGVLFAYELYGSAFPLTHLVVLSACETGVGRYYRGEGTMGLSRTFIAAGVPLVVASLWRVDSDSTADLMIAFHRYRKTQNLSSAAALQKAQQEMLNGADLRYRHPYYWAGFTLFGGYAKF